MRKIYLLLVVSILLAMTILILKSNEKQKSFVFVNGQKKPLQKPLRDNINKQIYSLTPQIEPNSNADENSYQSTLDTLDHVQKINKFNKK